MNDLERILSALGTADVHEALRAITQANEFMARVSAVTGKETYDDCVEAMTPCIQLARELGVLTEKVNTAEQLGTVLAWKSSHEELPKATAKVKDLEEAGRARDIAALVKEGLAPNTPENKHGGKLTPATAKFWETRSASELAAFLEIAPRVIPGEARPAASEKKINGSGAAADADGNAWENIKPAKRAEMQKSDPELYEVLRSDWEQRGKPAPTEAASSSVAAHN